MTAGNEGMVAAIVVLTIALGGPVVIFLLTWHGSKAVYGSYRIDWGAFGYGVGMLYLLLSLGMIVHGAITGHDGRPPPHLRTYDRYQP